jgi:hypothetical protein
MIGLLLIDGTVQVVRTIAEATLILTDAREAQ